MNEARLYVQQQAAKRRNKQWLVAIWVISVVLIAPLFIWSYNFFLFFHKLFYMGTGIPFKVPWTIYGIFAGCILGAWAAKLRYRLENKWVWYPAGALLFFMFIFLLINAHRL